MKPTLCSRCKKNLAVIFITKIDGGKTVNEGLCLKCAKEMGIKPCLLYTSPAHLPVGGGDIYVNLYDLADLPHGRARAAF